MSRFTVTPVGYVRGGRDAIEDDAWGDVTARIELDGFGADAVLALDEFSHVEVLFLFDRVDPDAVCLGARHPRGREDWPQVGIFAQRAKDRPNRLGLCTCELVAVEGASMVVRGLDAIDGTPVLDVKPYMTEFAPRGSVRQPTWSHELMAGYW